MKIYNDAKDKNVAATVLYESEGSYFYDSEFENEVDESEMFDLFVKGCIVFSSNAYAKPIGYNPSTKAFVFAE